MSDARLHKLAQVLVKYSTRLKKNDLVVIRGDVLGMPLVAPLYEECLRAGAHPMFWARMELHDEMLMEFGSSEQLSFVSPLTQHMAETIDASISYWAEGNTKHLSRFPSHKAALMQQGRKPFLTRFLERAAQGKVRWVGTQFPTAAAAQDAEMSLRQYEDFVFSAGLLHLPDPAAAWAQIFDRQELVRKFLQGKRELHFHVPPHHGHDGTDLRVDVSAATWVNCGGHENFPDGEVFAGPTLPPKGFGVEGHVNYTFPAVYEGREVEGVRLVFRQGRVVEASATRNQQFLLDMLDQDPGARNLGEIAIGTNYGIAEFSKNTLFDEKIGGTFHAAVGAGYPESGSSNESGLHWDMVCDLRNHNGLPGGTISADGEVFHRNGKFLNPAFPGNV